MFYKAWRRIAVILILFCLIYMVSKALPVIGNIFHNIQIFFKGIFYIIKQGIATLLNELN